MLKAGYGNYLGHLLSATYATDAIPAQLTALFCFMFIAKLKSRVHALVFLSHTNTKCMESHCASNDVLRGPRKILS